MKNLALLIVGITISALSSCSPTILQDNKEVIQPGLSLTAPNGVHLASSTDKIIANTKSSFENIYGNGITYTITKITYGDVAPFEKDVIKGGGAVARVDFKTSKGQMGNFIYVGGDSNSN